MGSGYTMRCPKCGYKFHAISGIGFMFPKGYEETVRKAKSGELGTEILSFFREHEDGAISAENVTLCCTKCGDLVYGKDLTMYVPKAKPIDKKDKNKKPAAPKKDIAYVSWMDLEEKYTEFAKYPHKCGKCGGDMRILDENEEVLCPTCKVPLEVKDHIMWDENN